MKRPVTIRVSKDTEKFLTEKFPTLTGGAETCILAVQAAAESGIEAEQMATALKELQMIRRFTEREMNNTLTQEEWNLLADVLNGTVMIPEMRCHNGGLIATIEDADHFEHVGSKHNIEIGDLTAQIEKFTAAQMDYIYTKVERFWSEGKW